MAKNQCKNCGQWSGKGHSCPVTAPAVHPTAIAQPQTPAETPTSETPKVKEGWARRLRRYGLFTAGNLGVGAGVSAIIASGVGAGPLDAFLTGVTNASGMSMGQLSIVASAIMVAGAWAAKVKPGIGTFVSFIGVGMVIDKVLPLLPNVSGPAAWAMWGAGALALAGGSGVSIASKVGASAYDQATLAVAKATKGLGRARMAIDGVMLGGAFAVGGPIGLGTVGMFAAFPLILPRAVALGNKIIGKHPAEQVEERVQKARETLETATPATDTPAAAPATPAAAQPRPMVKEYPLQPTKVTQSV